MLKTPATIGRQRGDMHEALVSALRDRVDGEIRFEDGRAPCTRPTPRTSGKCRSAVVIPRSINAAVEAVAVCREHGVPVLSRAAGRSLAGQCTNAAVVIDWSKYCNRLLSLDVEARTCLVEPGIVLDLLNKELASPRPLLRTRASDAPELPRSAG